MAAVIRLAVLSLVASIAATVPSLLRADPAGNASVIDGDTIEIHSRRIGLHGIDAPEDARRCQAEGKSWRCGIRLAAASDVKSLQCRIKGNVSSKGERIYHLPGGEFYDRTQVNAAKGERWFCTEEEARAAGWRRSKR